MPSQGVQGGLGWLARVGEFVVGAVTQNWGTKVAAFLLAVIVFVVTRDEVERGFTVPLRVIEDPNRVLVTEPPKTVDVWLRGPWTKVNRLGVAELGSATLDLREARPGPMELDPAAVVMPPGVVLDRLDYEPVDLRFEEVSSRSVPIEPVIEGQVAQDYRLVSSRVEPATWSVRGPASELESFAGLSTVAIDLEGATADVDRRVALVVPPDELEFVGVPEGERPTVRFVAEVTPIPGELRVDVATGPVLREALPKLDGEHLPESEQIELRGPRPALRELEGLDRPVRAKVEVGVARRGKAVPVTLRFEWAPEVPTAIREQLSIRPPFIRLLMSPAGQLDHSSPAP